MVVDTRCGRTVSGITAQALRTTLEAGFGTYVATQIQTTGSSYDVILEYDPAFQWDENALAALRVPASDGTLVPLASFRAGRADIRPGHGQPDRPADGGDAVVQPAGRRLARHGDGADRPR